jgi:hypothetical protein
MFRLLGPVVALACILLIGCGEKPTQPASTTPGPAATGSGTASSSPQGAAPQKGAAPAATAGKTAAQPATSQAVVIPEGTAVTVRVGQALGSKISQPGESFSATVAQPIEVGGKVVVPAGAEARGTVAEAVPRGRFKGGAKLRVALESITVNGKNYPVHAAAVTQAMKGKGKRTATMIGGGAGAGALIGGLVGGGKGAAIGALTGAGAGTAGSAFTGNKDIVIPAESALTFRLTQPVEVR